MCRNFAVLCVLLVFGGDVWVVRLGLLRVMLPGCVVSNVGARSVLDWGLLLAVDIACV